jgi:hypothetical protein
MGIAILAVATLGLGLIFLVGYVSAQSRGPTLSGNSDVASCAAACDNLKSKRGQVCAARVAVAAATATRDSISAQLSRAIAASAILLAAAIATGLIPIFGGILAVPLWSAWVTSHLYVTFLLGQLAGAGSALGNRTSDLTAATQMENEAADIVRQSCPPQDADSCINSLPACT